MPLGKGGKGIPTHAKTELLVVGGGIIGSLIAYQLRQAGFEVTLLEPNRPGAATAASAGILLPEGSSWAEESFERYPDLIREVSQRTGLEIPFAQDGVYLTDVSPVGPKWLEQAQRTRGGYLHPARFCEALQRAFELAGGRRIQAAATQVTSGRVELQAGQVIHADRIVVAAGAWSAQLLPQLKVYPLKGEALLLDAPPPHAPLFTQVGYVLPREGGLYLGATERENWREGAELGSVSEFMRSACRVFPHLREAPLNHTVWGFRPGGELTVGRAEAGIYAACGHSKLGVTLAPATAARIVNEIIKG